MIILYSTGCPKCKILKDHLVSSGVDFQERNSVQEMLKLGFMQAPMLAVDDYTVYNFDQAMQWLNEKE